ncbi:DUF1223 domain-containing protein [Pseudaestuariivita atlantica]|uniref:Uncharacterized protein n=1 Tax=Pseudaestuariivita atlantica TaxID=1317121 RepID=A0A0L1JUB8_9RHOB|nr:DUF1223 domain-containing protein [Pseudaestuariivita atlantica]KNG95379.1 hypothetical protein ATO11_01845 [Pseudaestuariivita atlantica]
MRQILALMLFAVASLGSVASAQDAGRTVLVELYTSQGCNSCPPADRLLGKLAQREDVIPLALHVDYWDYIGWKDSFASPQFTKRQRAYARAWRQRTIYTPQMVIGGLHPVVGSRPMDVATLIQKHAMAPEVATVSIARAGDEVTIDIAPVGNAPASVVQLVRYIPEQTVDITRGENGGRRLTYHNIVTDWAVIGEWDGQAATTLTADAPGDAPVVVIVQEAGYGAVLAAARIR